MNEQHTQALPPIALFFLTRRVACAVLSVVMLSTVLWFPGLFSDFPPLAFISAVGTSMLHMLTPGLFALISIGGGLIFSLHTAAITSALIFIVSDFALWPAIVIFVFYALIPIVAGQMLLKQAGFQKSISMLLFAVLAATILMLVSGSLMQDSPDIRTYVGSLIEPIFTAVPPAERQLSDDMLQQATQFLVWVLPGSLAISFWSIWSLGLLLARRIATRHGFFEGDSTSILELRFTRHIAYGFVILLLLSNFTSGDLQYLAISAAFLMGVAIAVQGIFVAHLWLKAKEMHFMIAVMYVFVFMQSMIVIPFMVLGLLDIWYDYRRNFDPAIGGK